MPRFLYLGVLTPFRGAQRDFGSMGCSPGRRNFFGKDSRLFAAAHTPGLSNGIYHTGHSAYHFKGNVRRVCNLCTGHSPTNWKYGASGTYPLEFVLRFAISILSNLLAPFSMRDCSRRTGVLGYSICKLSSNTASSSSISTREISLYYSLFIQLLSFTFT